LLDAIPRDRAPRDRARALGAVANMAVDQGDYEEAEALLQESDALCRELGDVRGSAHMQTSLAELLVARDQFATAEPLLKDCVTAARSLGDDRLLAVNLGNLAIVVYEHGDVDRAVSLREEALALARSVGDVFLVSQVLNDKGRSECRNGSLQSAEASFLESLTIARELGDPVAAFWALECFAELAATRHSHERAATILGAAAALREEIGHRISPHDEREHKRVAAAARAALGDDAFDRAWREGGAMALEEAVRYALDRRATVEM
jgi:tetratricopeptide (TPR) repeat protein